MNRKVRTVFYKELRDMLRDRRTIFAMAVIPVLLYPLMTIATAEVTQLAKAKLDRETFSIAIRPGTKAVVERILKLALEAPEPLKGLPAPVKKSVLPPPVAQKKAPEETSVKDLVTDQKSELDKPGVLKVDAAKQSADDEIDDKDDTLKTTKFDFKEMTAEAAAAALTGGTVRAIFVVPVDFEALVDAGKAPAMALEFDRAERVSQSAHSRIVAMLERYEGALLKKNLKSKNLSGEFLHPFTLDQRNIAEAEKLGGSLFGSILPLMFIIMLMTGALHPAIDMTAGEKERSTLETLVGSPARPIEIITGKFLAIATLSLMNAALNVSCFALSIKAIPLPANLAISFPWSALPLTLLLLLPLAMFFSALLIMVASFAANTKEAQVFCMPVFLAPVIGMVVAMTPGIELEGPLLLAPVVNTALLIKELFLGHGTTQQVCFVFFSTCLYAAGMVALAARVFAREEVLFSAQGSLRLFLSRRFFKPSLTPRAGDALLAAALLFPLNFYVQTYLQKILIAGGKTIPLTAVVIPLLAAMYGVFLAVPLIVAKYLKADFKSTFLWKAPSARAMFGALLMGSTSWLIASQLVAWQSRFWDSPDMGLEKLIDPLTHSLGGWALLVFLIALTPAICEEHFFRGFLQQGLSGEQASKRRTNWSVIILVGAIFGFFHIPVFRQPVTFLMGVALAWTASETGSLWPGALTHFMNNALAIFGGMILGLDQNAPVKGEHIPDVPMGYFAAAVGVFAAGVLLVRRRSED